jgi:Mlc titration factor MtfA (ptsG expression regulator)
MRKLWKRLRATDPAVALLPELAAGIPLLVRLTPTQRARLEELAAGFLRAKQVEGAGGLAVAHPMRALVALQACLPLLNLTLDLYRGWHAVVLYPDEFRAPFEYQDAAGVIHQGSRDLVGEAWRRGPVILAWNHVQQDAADPEPAGNVVIHEMAHKLDLLNGADNGMPPLHPDMDPRHWTRAMSAAFADLEWHLDLHREPPINGYAAHSPGEFFAVTSELFFAWPEALLDAYPEVYHQLAAYYRQDPGTAGHRCPRASRL